MKKKSIRRSYKIYKMLAKAPGGIVLIIAVVAFKILKILIKYSWRRRRITIPPKNQTSD